MGGLRSALFLLVWNDIRHDCHIRTYTRRLCAGSTPAAGIRIPRKALYLAFCGAFLFGMRKLLEWILKRGNGENVGRRDLISEGVTVDILERGSVRPAAALLNVGVGDIEVVEI